MKHSIRLKTFFLTLGFSSAFVVLSPVARAQATLDGFDPNANLSVLAIAVQPDGKIVIGGDFTSLAPNGGPTVTRNHIARLNLDGKVDPDLNPNANAGGSVHASQSKPMERFWP